MDKNLNIGTTIANNLVYHEGNHDWRGTPHEQYISKWNYNFTKTIGENNNKFYKIAKFDVERDQNIIHFFRLNIFSSKAKNDFNVDITIPNSLDNITVDYTYNSYFQIVFTKRYYTPKVGKDRYEVVIYIKPYKSYDQIMFMVTKSLNTVVSYYHAGFSYSEGFHLYNWEDSQETVEGGITATNNTKVNFQEHTYGSVTIQPNSKLEIPVTLNVPVNWNDFVSYCLLNQGHSDIMYLPAQLYDNGKKVLITLFNPTSSEKTVPQTVYLIKTEKR